MLLMLSIIQDQMGIWSLSAEVSDHYEKKATFPVKY